ncbi:MAG: hypothetical protein V4670_07430 [Bacteroidota bacterium]
MIKYFLFQSLLTLVLYVVFLTNSGIPGGVAGMTPFLVAILVLIQFVSGTVLFLIFKKYLISYRNKLLSVCFYTLLYEICAFIFYGEIIISKIFEPNYEGQLNRYYSFSSILSGIIIFIIVLSLEKINIKNEN